MAEIFDRFISNPHVDDKAKINKLRQLLVVFSNRWAEERTISCVKSSNQKYRDKCYELLDYTDKSLKMVDKLKDCLLHEQARSILALQDSKTDGNKANATPSKHSLLQNSEIYKYQEETKKLISDLREELKKSYEENDLLAEQLKKKK